MAALRGAHRRGHLRFAGQCQALAGRAPWERLIAALLRTDWVVYAKPPFGGPQRVPKYLSRYTHRVAVTNHRLVFAGDGLVRFRYTDYAHAHAAKEMILLAAEFLRRFVLHVLPPGFMRIRHYGLLANRSRARKLARCRAVLHPPIVAPPAEPRDPGRDSAQCHDRSPVCSGRLRLIERLAPHPRDTS